MNKLKLLVGSVSILTTLFVPTLALAQITITGLPSAIEESFGTEPHSEVSPGVSACSGLKFCNPLSVSDPRVFIGRVLQFVLGLVGTLALVMTLVGGIIWMTANGSEDRIKTGRDTLLWAVLGLVVSLGSYVLVSFLISNIPSGG